METPVQPKPGAKAHVSVSVRELVEFVLRRGDLGGSRQFVAPGRALEGTRGHQRLQKRRPAGYQMEVVVSCLVEREGFVLQLKGRVDGVLEEEASVLVEEIKTVLGGRSAEPDPLHWAQGKIYAHILLQQRPQLEGAAVRLAYLDLETELATEFQQTFSRRELNDFFEEVTAVYLEWARRQYEWQRQRDDSIRALPFPFTAYRAGQRKLAVAAYRSLARGGRLFAEAPTGIGKTISVLFPAVKVLGEGKAEKIFYLTAKTIGRVVAEKAIRDMRSAGLRLRTLTLTARDKICFNDGNRCDMSTCVYAVGYYDRLKTALEDCLQSEELNRALIEEVARRHQVCPFALSLDVALWVDAVICDYNYVFDPRAYLRRFFAERSGDYLLLIDEAHNLVDRAREMFSADLVRSELKELKQLLGDELPGCVKALGKIEGRLRDLAPAGSEEATATPEFPEALLPPLRQFMEEAEAWLVRNEPASFNEALREVYFRVSGFLRTIDLYDERYVTLREAQGEDLRLRLFCLDPSQLLRQALERSGGSVFFSATLSPPEYFRDTLGGEPGDELLRLESPFPTENLCLLVGMHIQTKFDRRASSYASVAEAIGSLTRAQRGNYLVYFPSYQYLNQVLEIFRPSYPEVAVIRQTSGMTEEEREAFMAEFHASRENTLVGFAVMGGIFGEGIDLVGERLVGAVVVGVGLPQICLERALIRNYFQEKNGAGFEFAYAFPGMNRVLQAAGRVIRSETDRGIVLLLDTRFSEARYQELFPAWWRPLRVRREKEIADAARAFWRENQ